MTSSVISSLLLPHSHISIDPPFMIPFLYIFITVHSLPPSLPVSPHLITGALVNKCITHELIHGSFSSAPYVPTVKPQQLFQSLCKYVFSQLVQAVCDTPERGCFTSPQTTVLIKTPQELEKRRSADTFKRDREELNTWEGLTPPHTANQL